MNNNNYDDAMGELDKVEGTPTNLTPQVTQETQPEVELPKITSLGKARDYQGNDNDDHSALYKEIENINKSY